MTRTTPTITPTTTAKATVTIRILATENKKREYKSYNMRKQRHQNIVNFLPCQVAHQSGADPCFYDLRPCSCIHSNYHSRGQSTGGTACTFPQLYLCNAERLAGKQLVPLNRKWLSRPEIEPRPFA